MGLPLVSIIIPTYKDWHRLALCLKALEAQTFSQDKFEIIVVNNAKDDLQPTTLRLPSNCVLITESRPGSYAARNKGLEVAKGDIIGFTDSDCIPNECWIERAVKPIFQSDEVWRVGGGIKMFFAGRRPNLAEVYDIVFAFPQQGYVEGMGWAVTANMFARKKCFELVGSFNDNLMSGGDFEWGRRANEHQLKIVYSEKAFVSHPARNSLKELLVKVRRTRRGKAELAFENGSKTNPSFLKMLYVIFRWRTDSRPEIKKKLSANNLSVIKYAFPILLMKNIVVGYGDFCIYQRRFQLGREKSLSKKGK